jgi:hypothetical protein
MAACTYEKYPCNDSEAPKSKTSRYQNRLTQFNRNYKITDVITSHIMLNANIYLL